MAFAHSDNLELIETGVTSSVRGGTLLGNETLVVWSMVSPRGKLSSVGCSTDDCGFDKVESFPSVRISMTSLLGSTVDGIGGQITVEITPETLPISTTLFFRSNIHNTTQEITTITTTKLTIHWTKYIHDASVSTTVGAGVVEEV